MAEQSLTEDIGMVVGFSRRESDIKQKRLINKNGDTDHRNHNRLSDNFLANFNWTPSVERSLELGFRLSNYEEGKYFATNLDNNVTDTHLAYGSTVKWTQRLGSGQLSATAAYDQFTDERKSNATYALVTSDLDNGMDYEEGGYGNSQLTQQNVQLKLHYEFDRLELAGTSHLPSIGAGYKKTSFDFNRDNDVTQKTVMYFLEVYLMSVRVQPERAQCLPITKIIRFMLKMLFIGITLLFDQEFELRETTISRTQI